MPKRILILDDDRSNGEALGMILEQEDFLIRCIFSSIDLYESLNNFDPHILFLDILLGEEDGRILCNEIKDRLETNNLPIILISAMLPNQIEMVPSKADGIICKPFDINEVIAMTKKFLLK
ncbi:MULTISPECIES: PleD family two-component system response regulator [Pedobacter]|uniref:response regulator n=1 Tax=Pedobacter TaxID=84567 RepID=UPI001E3BC6FE|nr:MULTISPECIES: response regulator [Pedobacter]